MSDTDEETAMWPGSPYALVDTRLCPGCFQSLTATTCAQCGLVVSDARAGRLLELGRSILSLETERQQLIDEIRLAHRPVPEPAMPAIPTAQAWWEAAPAPALPEAIEPVAESIPAPAMPEPAAAAPAAVASSAAGAAAAPPLRPAQPAASAISPRPPRRKLTVPVLLLILGVSLVGIAAIFFLVLAWNVADIRMRALIIGGITLTTMIVASLLRRWSLAATAEAIGALGVILLGLDSWAVRANDLFGAGAMDAVVYSGVAALAVGAICRLWSIISRLRGPDLAATLALPTGLGLLIAGLVPLEPSGAITAGLLGTAVGGLAHALPKPWSAARSRADSIPERTALAVIGVGALVGAAATALFLGLESMTVQVVAASVVIVLGAAYTVLLRAREGVERLPAAVFLGYATGALAAGFLGSLGWQMALHSDLPIFAALLGPVVAVAVAVGLDRRPSRVQELLAPRIAAALVGGVSVLALAAGCIGRAVSTIPTGWTRWDTPVLVPPVGVAVDAAVLSAIAAVVVAGLLFVAPTLDRPVLRDVRPIAASALLLCGAFGTVIPIVVVGTAIVVAVGGLVALGRGKSPAAWGTVAGLGALTAFLTGLASPWLWAVGVLAAVAVPIVARAVGRPNATAAVLLALAPVAVLTVAAFVTPAAIAAAFDLEPDARAGLVFVQWVSLAGLAAAASLRLDAASRTGLAASSYGLFAISLLALPLEPVAGSTVSAAVGEPVLGTVRTVLLLLLLALVALVRTRIDALPSLGAAALLAPATACVTVAAYETAGLSDGGWAALTAASAAAVFVWLGALVPSRAYAIGDAATGPWLTASAAPVALDTRPAPPPAYRTLARRFADVGALVTGVAAVSVGVATTDFRWAMLAIVALGFAGASVTAGWAGRAGAEPSGVPETRASGASVAEAPRRLLAWAAFAAATVALWLWLLAGPLQYPIEAFALPPAVGLLLFAAVLVWLRRQGEAAIAVTVALLLGLVVPAGAAVAGAPAFAAAAGTSPVRGTIVAIVASVVTLIFAWTPARRVRMPALAGAVVAMAALTIVAIGRALSLPAETFWLVLLVGIAYLSAVGFVRPSPLRAAADLLAPESAPITAERWFAAAVPPIALAGAAVATIPSLDEPLVVAVTLAGMILLHLAAAALHRLPFATATRWTAFAAATLAAAGALMFADVDAVELVSLPLAVALLGGAALAMWRLARAGRSWPGTERIVWLAGLFVAVAPSVIAAPDDVRTWLVIVAALLAATECVVVPLSEPTGLKTPSAILLSAGTIAMGVRALLHPAVESGEVAAMVAGLGVIAIAALMIWQAETDLGPRAATGLAAGGAALVVVTVGVEADGGLIRSAVTAVAAGVVGVGGAALLRWRRWQDVGAVLAIAGVLAAIIAVGSRFAEVAADGGLEPDLWAAAGVGIVVAVGVAALRSTSSGVVSLVVSVAFSIALVLFAAAEVLMLGAADPDELRTALTMIALVAVGVIGYIWRERLGTPLPVTAAVLAGVFGVVALTAFGVRPFELVTVPVALGLIILGVRALLRDSAARTWPTLGPGVALLTLPSLLYDFTDPSVVEDPGATALARVVSLGVVAVGLVVVGAVWRLQAPLVLGAAVLLVHAVAQLWPWISDLYAAVEWWVWLGIGGALLIYLGARYERRMRALRTAFTAVTSLR